MTVPPIVWSDHAIRDLSEIGDRIARSSPRYANVVVTRLITAVDALADFPELGHVVPELREPTVRELIRGNYRIVYEMTDARIEILTVFHSARRFPSVDDSDT